MPTKAQASDDVTLAYCKVNQLYSGASHVIAAFKLPNRKEYEDDGDHAMGRYVFEADPRLGLCEYLICGEKFWWDTHRREEI